LKTQNIYLNVEE